MSGTPSREAMEQEIVERTRHWLEAAVIGLNLCPFAKSVYVKNQVRFAVSFAEDAAALHQDLIRELQFLQSSDPEALDTTLLIHPFVLNDFLDYNDFLDIADAAVVDLELDGVLQVASFHPDYQFADTDADDITNFTNRAPYPILHLLRESSVERAVEAFPEASSIFERNMETMRSLGRQGWETLMESRKAS
ncbi:MAG TPA: DUF1415 domain-containing protein [Noviherbaspirillum sp.]|nr:DUF1415 domain-containing protein [Noviherbaspirillum sp.]